MTISIIVSVSENWVIGKDNKLLWKISSDLRRFKDLTLNHPVIMGQKTFESLPNGALPNRTNIVLTDDSDFTAIDVIPAFNIDQSLELAKYYYGEDCEVFIIGGGSIYKQFLPLANKLYLTTVHIELEGDTTFPIISESDWNQIYSEFHSNSDKDEYAYTFKILERNE